MLARRMALSPRLRESARVIASRNKAALSRFISQALGFDGVQIKICDAIQRLTRTRLIARVHSGLPLLWFSFERYPVRLPLFNPKANPRCVRLLRIIKYLAVPNSLVSCCEYLKYPR